MFPFQIPPSLLFYRSHRLLPGSQTDGERSRPLIFLTGPMVNLLPPTRLTGMLANHGQCIIYTTFNGARIMRMTTLKQYGGK
jgi:hypothetical protein